MNLPTIKNYGDYSSDNYGVHTLEVEFPNLCLYYSYDTVVAYIYDGKRVVRHNSWSTTTGKHLNWIDDGDKKSRINGEQFEKQLEAILTKLGLA